MLQPTLLGAFGGGFNGFSDTVSYFKPMDYLSQGTSRNNRIGDAVTIMSIEWRYCITFTDYEQEVIRVLAFTAPFGFTPTYGNIFEAPDGNVDVRVARPNSNITVLKQYKHTLSPLNSSTASSSSTSNTPQVFRTGCLRLLFPGGRKFQYSYNNYTGSSTLFNRNRDIFIVAVPFAAKRLQGSSTVQYTFIQGQELAVKFKDA